VQQAPPSLLSRFVRRLLIAIYRLRGWHVEGRVPPVPKFIVIGAPHTSNWDFAVFLGAIDELGVQPSYIGKHSLFRWPMRRFFTDMGGIPIDRTKRHNYVIEVANAIAKRDRIVLVIAPEGTRNPKGAWHSGFYHIAMRARVPIVPAWIDRERRRAGLGEPITPSGDYQADLAKIATFYRANIPGHPRLELIRL
jgi:1-acyl-sn-glycerol-3-phosphate acyltransferase